MVYVFHLLIKVINIYNECIYNYILTRIGHPSLRVC